MPDAAQTHRPASRSRVQRARASTCFVVDGEKETLSERIGKIGFGWYQVQCFGFSCGFIVAEAAELAMASGIVKCVGREFGIVSDLGLSTLMTTTFAGLTAGTLAAGPIGDRYGRRPPMALSSAGIPCCALLTYNAPTLSTVYGFRFMLGFFSGLGIPMAVVILSEVSPKHLRGIAVAAMGVAWCIGEFYAAVGLWLMAPDLETGPWRKLVLWAAGPALKLIVCGLLSPVTRYDTAHWLASHGRTSDMVAAVNLMAHQNSRPECCLDESGTVTLDVLSKPSDNRQAWHALAELVKVPLLVYSIVQAILFFAKDFALYGTSVLWPLAWAQARVGGPLKPAEELAATALLGVPGVFLAMVVMYVLPRRLALGTAAVLCAAASWALESLRAHGSVATGLLGVAVFKLSFPVWQMVTMLLPAEIFPTEIKSCGYSIVSVFGRFATIIAPMAVGFSQTGFLLINFSLALLAALCVQLLPETSGVELTDAARSSVPPTGTTYGAA